MAGSVNEVSGSLDVLESSEEGKKKSKFKAFKSFFGKKKKKDSEDVQGAKLLKTSIPDNINTSSLKPAHGSQQVQPRPKSSMGNKAISHDSIFLLDPQSERPASKMFTSMERQKGRLMQVPPLPPRQPSISPSLIRSDIFSDEFKEISVDDEPVDSSQTKASSYKILALKKNFTESSSVPDLTQSLAAFASITSPGNTQKFSDFPTPATSQSCLDSSAARHKMTLNPRKQKKNFQATVKAKQEEPSFLLVTEEEKSMRKPKDADQKLNKDSEEPTSQKQNNETEIYDKTTEQAPNTDASGNLGGMTAVRGRCRRVGANALGMSECGSKGRSSVQSSKGHGLGDGAGSLPTDKTAKDCSFWNLHLQTKVTEQLTTPQVETATAQKLLSDEGDMGGSNDDVHFQAENTSAPQPLPENMEASMASGPPSYHEHTVSAAKKLRARALASPGMESSSARPEEAIHSVAEAAQVIREPSQIQSAEGSKMQPAQDVPAAFKGEPPGNIIQAFIVSEISGMIGEAEEIIFSERLPPLRLSTFLGQHEAEEVLSESENDSEDGSRSEEQVIPAHSRSRLGKPEAKETSDSESGTQEQSNSEELAASGCSPPSLGKFEDKPKVFPKSKHSVMQLSRSGKQQAPSYPSRPFEECQVEKVPRGSSGRAEKYSSAEDLNSLEGQLPIRPRAQALRKPRDQAEVSSVPKNTAEGSGSAEQTLPTGRPVLPQQLSSSPLSSSTEQGISEESVSPPNPYQPSEGPNSEHHVSVNPKGVATDWGISMEPLPPRMSSKRSVRPKAEQQVPSRAEVTATGEVVSPEALSPKRASQPLLKSVVEQEDSSGSKRSAGEKDSVELRPPELLSQPLIKPQDQQDVLSGSEAIADETGLAVALLLPEDSPQSSTTPQVQGIVSESAAAKEDVCGELSPPGCPPQASVRPSSQLQKIVGSASASAQWEATASRHSQQAPGSPAFEQVSAGSESAAAEGRMSVELESPRPHAQPPAKAASAEGVAPEGGVSAELLLSGHASPSTVTHDVQKMATGPQSAAVEGRMSGEAVPPKCSTQLSVKSKVQEISSRLTNTTKVEKSLLASHPSRSFVKFMAQQIFSEDSAPKESSCTDPPPPKHPSKSLLRPKMDHKVFSDREQADPGGGRSSKTLPLKHSVKSVGRPKDLQEVPSSSEHVPVKRSTAEEQLPRRQNAPALGKFECQQEVPCVSESSPEEWRPSRESLPPRRAPQALNGSQLQPQTCPAGSVDGPVRRSSPQEHLQPRNPLPPFGDSEYEQQVLSNSTSATTKGTILEGNSGRESLPKGSVFPNKTKQHSAGSEDLMTVTTKPRKFTLAPASKTPVSGGTYSKREGLESGDGNNDNRSNVTTNEAGVEKCFGVQLRRLPSSRKYKSTKLDNFAQLPPLPSGPIPFSEGREQRMRRRASRGLLDTAETTTTIPELEGKQLSEPKSEAVAQKQPAYKTPGKHPGQQSDSAISEPAWITMAKQKQKGFQTPVPMRPSKFKDRTGAEAATKEPVYVGADPENDNQSRKIFTSNVHRQKMAQMKLIKSAVLEDQKILHIPAKQKETKESSTFPAKSHQPVELAEPVEPAELVQPVEPVWFSMAKKKSKAWSHKT
ncbi:acrosomal protein KIAA1210 homolog isoform X2 [Oryctolagus cuniculus]|uniref:acrosomal protein KIAA1210 homolog isoform X2 n=1 Tax=Oryctolagus cuniculus TaxID=9986 RepID=UPI00222F1243|nr:acrosomal protein KIAA1210 homolog isoform X2 [Oryctolagus cuniculus]